MIDGELFASPSSLFSSVLNILLNHSFPYLSPTISPSYSLHKHRSVNFQAYLFPCLFNIPYSIFCCDPWILLLYSFYRHFPCNDIFEYKIRFYYSIMRSISLFRSAIIHCFLKKTVRFVPHITAKYLNISIASE